MIFPLNAGRLLLAGGLVSCQCCPPAEETFELAIKYGWEGTGQVDLDTKTVFLSEQVGWKCGFGGTYLAFGGNPAKVGTRVQDVPGIDGEGLMQAIITQAAEGPGWVSYDITNPATGKVQSKMSYVCELDGVYLGCGIYKSLAG